MLLGTTEDRLGGRWARSFIAAHAPSRGQLPLTGRSRWHRAEAHRTGGPLPLGTRRPPGVRVAGHSVPAVQSEWSHAWKASFPKWTVTSPHSLLLPKHTSVAGGALLPPAVRHLVVPRLWTLTRAASRRGTDRRTAAVGRLLGAAAVPEGGARGDLRADTRVAPAVVEQTGGHGRGVRRTVT